MRPAVADTVRMRIRITKIPRTEEFAEYTVGHLQLGNIYDLGSRLAELLILSGCAVPETDRAGDDKRLPAFAIRSRKSGPRSR